MKFSRRTFIAGAGAALAAAGLGISAIARRDRWGKGGKRPNIALFIADDLRYNALGYQGDALARTPFLDSLATESFIFNNHYVTTSTCPTSRASIMTGAYYRRHGAYINRNIHEYYHYTMFPLLLRENGYHTGFLGKWGFGAPGIETRFDEWYDIGAINTHMVKDGEREVYLTDYLTQRAQAFFDNAPAGKPSLLIVSYKAPHDPYNIPNAFEAQFDGVQFPREATDTPEAIAALPPLLQTGSPRRAYEQVFADNDNYQKIRRNYYGMVSGIDDSIRQVVAKLKEKTLWDDTLCIFTSDNGYLFGDHGMIGKSCMYEASIRTPLLIRLPQNFYKAAARKIGQISLNIDIAATALAAAGVAAPRSSSGSNLFKLMLAEKSPRWRNNFYYEMPGYCEGYRYRKWKYTRYIKGKDANEVLFNLKKDPLELKNLAENPDHASTLEKLRGLMAEEKKRVG